MYLNVCPFPNATHDLLADISETAATAISTASVSTVRIRTSHSHLSVARSITHFHQCSVEYFTIYDLGLQCLQSPLRQELEKSSLF